MQKCKINKKIVSVTQCMNQIKSKEYQNITLYEFEINK